MKFITKVRINANKMVSVQSPSMLYTQRMIPQSVRIETMNPDAPARDVQCKIMTGPTEIENNQEAYFNVNDEVSLVPHYKVLQRAGDLTLTITNKCTELREFRVIVDYVKCEGVLMHQERYDSQYEKVFTNAATAGYCTRMVLSFNRPVAKLQLTPLTMCDPGDSQFEWLSTQEIAPCDVENGGRPVFVIADEDMQQLASYMEYIQLSVEDSATQEVKDRQNLQMYVLAYGFPKK
jgi:hypothetical protein